LAQSGLATPPAGSAPYSRIIVEKPVGRDLASAQQINEVTGKVFDESQIFRIDHYLGKETVQNLMVVRFANSIFEPIWNHKYIDHVQITVSEAEGVGTRASYYEEAGALRDMIQNHLLQLLCLVAMEPPYSLDPNVVRNAKMEVLRCLRPIVGKDVEQYTVRAQYAQGTAHGQPVPGYRREKGVSPRLHHRNVCGGESLRGKLALVRRTVLSSNRKGLAETRERSRRAIQRHSADSLQREPCESSAGKCPDAADPAG
jgi:glucose-6-phosphate 1-dehydrogenase